MAKQLDKHIIVKPPTTYAQQIKILKDRGLLIEDEDAAAKILEYTNYYRLRGYYIHLQKKDSDDFIDGVTFDEIISLHKFDNELRTLLLKLLLDIEIVARSRIAYNVGHAWGAMGYRNEENYSASDHDKYIVLMNRIDDDLGKSRERFVKTYIEKYEGQFPIWVAVEVMSFGDLSKLYNLLPTEIKKTISSAYDGLDETLLTNWIQCSAILRNLCAHNSRIYSRNIPIPIKIENNVQAQISEVTEGKFQARPQTLFSYLLAIRRISINETWNEFVKDFDALLLKYGDTVEPMRLGLPYQWKLFISQK